MVINSEAGRRIIVLVATSEGILGCPLPVVQLPCGAYLLLPAGPAAPLVYCYELCGPRTRQCGAEAAFLPSPREGGSALQRAGLPRA